MIDYSLHPCDRCAKPSMGFFRDFTDTGEITKYYCNAHWHARKSAEDKIQDQREFEMFKDQKWYQEKFPHKFGDPAGSLARRVQEKRQQKPQAQQMSLFT